MVWPHPSWISCVLLSNQWCRELALLRKCSLSSMTPSDCCFTPRFPCSFLCASTGNGEGSRQLFLPSFPKRQGNTWGCPLAVHRPASPLLFVPAPPLRWPPLQHAKKNREALKPQRSYQPGSALRGSGEGDPGHDTSVRGAPSTPTAPAASARTPVLFSLFSGGECQPEDAVVLKSAGEGGTVCKGGGGAGSLGGGGRQH